MADPITLSQFLAEAAHDIKQPLNVLQMYLGILQRQTANSRKEELEQVVSDAMRSVQSSTNLITQWARCEQQALKENPQPVDESDWEQLCSNLKGVTAPELVTAPQHQPLTLDASVIQQTLQEMLYLLPKPVTLSSQAPWQLILTTTRLTQTASPESDYRDALYQLALSAGGVIIQESGGTLTVTHEADHSILQLQF